MCLYHIAFEERHYKDLETAEVVVRTCVGGPMKKSITSAAPLASWSRFSFFLATSPSKPRALPRPHPADFIGGQRPYRHRAETLRRQLRKGCGQSDRWIPLPIGEPHLDYAGAEAGVRPWRRMISPILARYEGPPPAALITSATYRK